MWLDLTIMATISVVSLIGTLVSQRKEPVRNREQATRNTNQDR